MFLIYMSYLIHPLYNRQFNHHLSSLPSFDWSQQIEVCCRLKFIHCYISIPKPVEEYNGYLFCTSLLLGALVRALVFLMSLFFSSFLVF